MKASTTTIVALAIRDEALTAKLAARLTSDGHAVVLPCFATDPAHLAAWLQAQRVDVLLLDERWLHRLVRGSLTSLRETWPDLRIVLVGERESAALADQVVRNRFQGLLLATAAADVWLKAVRAVACGEMWLPRGLLVKLLFEYVHAARYEPCESAADSKLTRREAEVVGYVRRGLANKQIADTLAIREDTVKKHLRNAYSKLGVHRRSEIITGNVERLVGA